jgi:hypothetical protein
MKFEDLLNDIEKLIGLRLCSINPATPGIELTNIDREKQSYTLQVENSPKESSRSFKELLDIWNNLALQGYVNVDQALYGGGSSRNQPETILANLPYIQHFKYNNKKHLLLRKTNMHDIGTLQELSDPEQIKLIKDFIDNHKNFNISKINSSLKIALNQLEKGIDSAIPQHSKDQFLINIRNALFEFKKAQQEIACSIVSLDDPIDEKSHGRINITEATIRLIKPDLLADSSIYTGVEDGEEESDEDNDPTTKSANSSKFTEPVKLNFRRQTPTFALLYERLAYNEIEIQPEYQRKDRIWSKSQKSKLIESILMGLPLPVFYFGEKTNGDWTIIDGLQRLTTIQDFVSNRFALTALEELDFANTLTFDKLTRLEQRKILEFEITAYIVDATKGTEKFITELFHRINTYGVKLSNQEIRTAVNLGASVPYLKFLATSEPFLIATNRTVNPDRQKDLELCLAAVAYMLHGYENYDSSKYDDFLSDTMRELNREDFDGKPGADGKINYHNKSLLLQSITEKFNTSLSFSVEIFGETAFKKAWIPGNGEPLNKQLFEIITSTFSNLSPKQMDLIKEKKDDFLKEFYWAIDEDSTKYAQWTSSTYESKNRGFNFSLSQSTGKRVTVLYRFNSFLKIVEESTGCKIAFIPLLTK